MVASFSVGTRETKDKTEWHKCIAWDKQAEFISKYFKKGSYILLTGRLQTRSYEDKDGKTIYTTEIIAENAEFGGKGTQESKQDEKQDYSTPPIDDELPF
jgi:single-strand DNA-binding protein